VALVPLDAASGRLLIVDQIGAIYVLTKEGKLMDWPFLDLRGRLGKLKQGFDERGLLGLALHPQFQNTASAGFQPDSNLNTIPSAAKPQPQERGPPSPRESNAGEETRGQGCPRS
jgi:hypothetical protein